MESQNRQQTPMRSSEDGEHTPQPVWGTVNYVAGLILCRDRQFTTELTTARSSRELLEERLLNAVGG
jgi:hypothetical protein